MTSPQNLLLAHYNWLSDALTSFTVWKIHILGVCKVARIRGGDKLLIANLDYSGYLCYFSEIRHWLSLIIRYCRVGSFALFQVVYVDYIPKRYILYFWSSSYQARRVKSTVLTIPGPLLCTRESTFLIVQSE